jgi:hypothetical protein
LNNTFLFEYFNQSLEQLEKKLNELSRRIQGLLNSNNNKNGVEILDKLISLQSSIIKKRTAIEEKSLKIKSLII